MGNMRPFRSAMKKNQTNVSKRLSSRIRSAKKNREMRAQTANTKPTK